MTSHPHELAWRTRWARLTGFPAEPIRLDVDWWQQVAGSLPETANVNHREGNAQYVGPIGRPEATEGTKLLLQVEPQRYEWRLLVDPGPAGNASIGAADVAEEMMQWLAGAWLPSSPELVRLAYGGLMFVEAADQPAALKAISHLLPFDPRPENTSDFIYRVNRRAASGAAPGRTVNRMQKWSSITAQNMTLRMGASGIDAEMRESRSTGELEFDINDVPEGPIERTKLTSLFDEFMDFAVQMRMHGDVNETVV